MNSSTSPVDIRPDHLEIVQDILREHLPAGVKVWVFGSRANWTTKDSSDLDLALESESRLNHKLLGALKDAFEDSTLPYTVDVVDLNAVSHVFKQIVKEQRVALPSVCALERVNGTWREDTLGDVAEIVMGQSPPGDKVSGDNGLALLNGPTEFGASHPTPVQFTTDARKYAQPGDILFCVRGSTTGRMNWADQEYAIGRGVAAIRHKKDSALQPFVRGVIELGRSELLAQATGSTFPNVSAQQLAEIPYPNLGWEEQQAIAHILGTLDDKIELNRRMNETLEAMARALFKSWFVDFEPVRAKMEGRWLRGESLPGLPAEHYDLFPDRLVDSELGEIPEGWGVKELGDICHKPQYGYTASASDEHVGPKFLRITDINKKAWIEWEAVPYCEITDENRSKYRLRHGDILIARMADPGHGCMVEEDRDAVFASYLIRFRPKDERYARLLQYWLRSDAYWELVIGRGAGTTRVSLNAKVLSEFPLVVPSTSLLDAFGVQVGSLRTRLVANVEESRILAAQRHALLPGLVSGEVRV